jgi:cephalosporin hydroxylase
MAANDVSTAFEREKRKPTDMIEHMDVLRAYSSRCERVVEFGVYDCTSTWALLAGCPKKLTSYDIDRRAEVADVEHAAVDSGTDFRFVLASSLEIEIDECDLLFVDSMHTYEHLRQELALHAARVAKFILMHDTTTFGLVDQTGQGRGLWPAVEEFLATHPEWSLAERRVNCHGLTVLRRAA